MSTPSTGIKCLPSPRENSQFHLALLGGALIVGGCKGVLAMS
jgi:hypothetical protein